MNVLVLGATGRTGHEVLAQALVAGHRITALVREPTKVSVVDPNLTVIRGNVIVPVDLRSALTGQDVVVSTIGSHRVVDALISTATETLIEAMDTCGVKRIVMMSNAAVGANFRVSGLGMLLHPTAKSFAADMASGEALLRDSDLDWTIVRATRLTNGVRVGRVRIVGADQTLSRRDTVARADVADFLLQLLEEPNSIGQVITVAGQP